MYVGIPTALLADVITGLRGLQRAMGRLESTQAAGEDDGTAKKGG
jgi:hypothetical protein